MGRQGLKGPQDEGGRLALEEAQALDMGGAEGPRLAEHGRLALSLMSWKPRARLRASSWKPRATRLGCRRVVTR